MIIKNGYLQKMITSNYVWFETLSDGFIIHGVPSNSPAHPYLIRTPFNRIKDVGLRIPKPILQTYDIRDNEDLTVVPVDQDENYFVQKPCVMHDVSLSPARTKCEIDPDKKVFLNQIHKGSVICNSGFYTEALSLEEIEYFSNASAPVYNITINRKHGVWMTIEKASARPGAYSLSFLQDLYGRNLQNYPFETIRFLVNADTSNQFPVPEWFLTDVFGATSEHCFNIYLFGKKQDKVLLLPVQKCELSGEDIDFQQEMPKVLEFSEEALLHKSDIADLAKSLSVMHSKIGMLLDAVNDYKRASENLKSVISLNKNDVKTFFSDLENIIGRL